MIIKTNCHNSVTNPHDYQQNSAEKSHFRKEWVVVDEDQYFNAATVSAHPTNPIQLSAAKKHRSIQGFESFLKVKTRKNGNSPTLPTELISRYICSSHNRISISMAVRRGNCSDL